MRETLKNYELKFENEKETPKDLGIIWEIGII